MRSWSDERGQALVEFALAFPLVLLALTYAFAIIDASATQAALVAGTGRAALVLAGTNNDERARSAALSAPGWLLGQQVSFSADPPQGVVRCAGKLVTVRLSARGHLGFLMPSPVAWSWSEQTAIENEGDSRVLCRPR